jgi:hypothetical protein
MKGLETCNSAGILGGWMPAVSFIFTRAIAQVSSGVYRKNNLRTTRNRPTRGLTSSCSSPFYVIVNGEEGSIKGTSTEIIDNLEFTAFLLQSVGNSNTSSSDNIREEKRSWDKSR